MTQETQLGSPKAILNYMFAGDAIFTLRSVNTDTRYTYKIVAAEKRNPNDPETFFLKVLTGPDNLRDYVYVGIIRDGEYRWTAKAKMGQKSGPIVAFVWALKAFQTGNRPSNLEFFHLGRCGRCGRTLTVPESILTGIGPDCAAQMGIEQVQLPKVAAVKPTQNFLFDAVDTAKEVAADEEMTQEQGRQEIKRMAIEEGIWTAEDFKKMDEGWTLSEDQTTLVPPSTRALQLLADDWQPALKQQAENRTNRAPAQVKVEVLNTNAKVDAALVSRMVAWKRFNDPEGFFMDGEMDVNAATDFWTTRYAKMPLDDDRFWGDEVGRNEAAQEARRAQ